jgi:hypothetical protein
MTLPAEEEPKLEETETSATPEAEDSQLSKDMELVASVANKLVSNDPSFTQLIASMLAARQLYAMCLYELEWLCRETDFSKGMDAFPEGTPNTVEDMTDQQKIMFKEVLINAAAVQAQQPFDEQVLFAGMTKTVFPWMQTVVTKHSAWQAAEKKRVNEEREQQRISTPINLGIQIYAENEAVETHAIGRHKPLLLVGKQDAVRWVLNRITANVLTPGSGAVQLTRLLEGIPSITDSHLVNIPKEVWENCASSNQGFQKIYDSFVSTQINDPVDMVVVDNLLQTCKGLSSIPATSIANEAQRRFKNWGEKAGALVLGCLPLDRGLRVNELNGVEYETLRIHNILRGVVAEPCTVNDAPHFKIWVGQHEVAQIPATELEAFHLSKIITA